MLEQSLTARDPPAPNLTQLSQINDSSLLPLSTTQGKRMKKIRFPSTAPLSTKSLHSRPDSNINQHKLVSSLLQNRRRAASKKSVDRIISVAAQPKKKKSKAAKILNLKYSFNDGKPPESTPNRHSWSRKRRNNSSMVRRNSTVDSTRKPKPKHQSAKKPKPVSKPARGMFST